MVTTTRRPGPLTHFFALLSRMYLDYLPQNASYSPIQSGLFKTPSATPHISQPLVDPSGPGKAGEQITVLRVIEVLPPVLVLHLKRFSYDGATGGLVKTGKPIQLSPGLDIPSCTIPSFIFPHGSKAENPS